MKILIFLLIISTPCVAQNSLYQRNKEIMDSVRALLDSVRLRLTAAQLATKSVAYLKAGTDSVFGATINAPGDTTFIFRYKLTAALPASSATGSYTDLINKPTIPTNTNQLSNGAGYLLPADITSKADASAISNLNNTSDANKPVSTATQTALNLKANTSHTHVTADITNFPTTTASFANSTDKNFVTDAKLTVVNNTSGTNTGDNATNTQYSGLISNATHTGDATGATALTVVKINGTSMAGLATGILKNTTSTGVPSIAIAADFPTLNQNTTGTSAGISASITESQVTNLVNDLAAKQSTITAGSITNTQLAGSIDLTTKVIGVLPFSQGGMSAAAATSATTGTMTVNMTTSLITITPTGACTFNASGGVAGQITTFSITTSGVSSFTLTWGTNFRKTGTLATGTTTARFFTVAFICLDGTTWAEIARTTVQS